MEVVETLSPEDQETLTEIIRLRLVQRRREEIALAADAMLQAVREGQATLGTVEDLKWDLLPTSNFPGRRRFALLGFWLRSKH